MTIRPAIFVDGAWEDSGGDSWSALVTVNDFGLEIKPYTNAEVCDRVRFSFEEWAAIVKMVAQARQGFNEQGQAR
jgi:hypothetical protein